MKLKTQRLVLREPKMSDWKDLVEGLNDRDTSRYLAAVAFPYKEKDAKEWIKHCIKEWKEKEKTSYHFFIELRSEKKIIGAIDIANYSKQHKTCETGSWINKEYWRKGYIMEAKIAVNEFAFNRLKVRKMETGVYKENTASNKAQTSIGYKYEGCKLKHHIAKSTGKIHDENFYGLMKEDWKKNLSKLKKHLQEKIKNLEGKK
jgi:ribosomal-protein-alanine N-acetyltransferase